jgi:tRNA dimethylallyltransferase
MFDQGLLDEARSILAAGFTRDAKALESIGYREAVLCLSGNITLEQAIEQTQAATRQYAKRQDLVLPRAGCAMAAILWQSERDD